MIKRIFSFNKKDWKHIWWLFINMIKQALKFNFSESYEAWLFIKLHFTYDSKLVEGDSK